MTRALTEIDFNLKVDGKELAGALTATQEPHLKPIRKERKAAGRGVQNSMEIVGVELKPLEFTVDKYPTGLDSLPVGEQVELILYSYYRDAADQSEHGVRHHITGEIDLETIDESKPNELKNRKYTIVNASVFRKYVDDQIIDEWVEGVSRVVMNGKPVFENRNRFLGRAG
jgi:phage tail tube protein FII